MFTRHRLRFPELTGNWLHDGHAILKAISEYFLSLEKKGAIYIDQATIEGSPIGASSPSTGNFTTLTATDGSGISGVTASTVSNGDKGDIVITAGVWELDPTIVTTAARTVLDDATVAAMVNTLGGATSTGTGGLVRATSPVLTTPNIGNATGNISGNAATVTTNANLTGPITSIGNATSVAAQTGTGSTFVMQASPSLTTPTINTAASVGGAWTAAATWTLPAFTLGGMVTSNGQSFSGTIANLGTVTTADINGGTVDGAVIGGASAAAGTFTTLSASGSFDASVADSFPVVRTSGSYGGGFVMLDGAVRSGFYTQSTGSELKFFAGMSAGEAASANIIATMTATGINSTAIGATTAAAGTFTALTSTGNTILGDASTDTLNVGNGGIIKDASGNVGIGMTPTAGHGILQVAGYVKHSSFADVRAFGAGADGNTDHVEIQAAIDSLASGGTLYFPPGDYTITTGLTCSGKSLKILGAGCGASRLIIDVANSVGVGNGLDFDGEITETATDVLQIQDITILAATSARDYAIKADWLEAGGLVMTTDGYRVAHCAIIENVEFGNTGTGGYLKYGLYLNGCHNAIVSNCSFYGARQSDDAYVSGGSAIFMTGDLTPVATDAVISNCLISRFEYGITLDGEVEGTHVKGCAILSCKYGIYTNYTTAPGPGLWVSDNHFNCWTYDIYSIDASELIITGNSFWTLPYNAALSDTTNYGIYSAVTSGAARSVIAHNTFWLSGTSRTTVYGIYISGTHATNDIESYLIDANRFGMESAATNSYAVYLTATTSSAVVLDTNVFTDSSWTANISDNATLGDNVIEGYATYTPTITAASGTITTASATGWYYRKRNHFNYHMDITITTNGTGATAVKATLPIGSASTYHNGSGRGDVVSGKALQVQGSASQNYVQIFNYDNTYPGADTEVLRISGHYQL